jgi:hypothetical protein
MGFYYLTGSSYEESILLRTIFIVLVQLPSLLIYNDVLVVSLSLFIIDLTDLFSSTCYHTVVAGILGAFQR